jgi:hypothetical protein
MLELADIVRAAGEVYERLHTSALLPSQWRAMATRAPSLAKANAVALPIPELPPVTRAILPFIEVRTFSCPPPNASAQPPRPLAETTTIESR